MFMSGGTFSSDNQRMLSRGNTNMSGEPKSLDQRHMMTFGKPKSSFQGPDNWSYQKSTQDARNQTISKILE
jgi:hypothetical protein